MTDQNHEDNDRDRRIGQAALMARLDERTQFIGREMEKVAGAVVSLTSTIDGRFATKEEIKPIKLIVYGLVALILTGVFGSIIALVVK